MRALFDWAGKPIKKAGPSIPAEILGLDEVPQPGETFTVVKSEREARSALADSRARERDAGAPSKRASLEDLYAQMQSGQIPQLSLVVKCDVQGSLEALAASLEKLATNEVGVTIESRDYGDTACIPSIYDILRSNASDTFLSPCSTKSFEMSITVPPPMAMTRV